jgi:hypothetical protein
MGLGGASGVEYHWAGVELVSGAGSIRLPGWRSCLDRCVAWVCDGVVVWLIIVGVLVWIGATLLLDAWWEPQPTDLVERLMPFEAGSVADEAQRGLDRQS